MDKFIEATSDMKTGYYKSKRKNREKVHYKTNWILI